MKTNYFELRGFVGNLPDVRHRLQLIPDTDVEGRRHRASCACFSHDNVGAACLVDIIPGLLESPRQTRERDHRGDPDGDANNRQQAAGWTAQKILQNEREERHGGSGFLRGW